MKEKNVYILVDAGFLNNSSGINTFVKHVINMFINELNVNIKLITDDKNIILSNDCYCNIDIITCEKFMQTLTMNTPLGNQRFISEKIKKAVLDNIYPDVENIFIANSYSTTLTLINIMNIYKKSRFITYTHIGDIFSPELENSFDFSSEITNAYLELLKNNEKLEIFTQSEIMKKQLFKVLKSENLNIEVVTMPIFVDFSYDDFDKYNDIIIICSNYKRKRFDKMFKFLEGTELKVKILMHDTKGYYNIEELCKQYKINVDIYKDIPNEYVQLHICSSKMLLHFSDIEVYPFSILESSFFIPVVINNAEWCKSFEEIAILVDYDTNYNKIVSELETKPTNNYKKYKSKFLRDWKLYCLKEKLC